MLIVSVDTILMVSMMLPVKFPWVTCEMMSEGRARQQSQEGNLSLYPHLSPLRQLGEI